MIICKTNTVFAKSDFWSKTRQPAPVSPSDFAGASSDRGVIGNITTASTPRSSLMSRRHSTMSSASFVGSILDGDKSLVGLPMATLTKEAPKHWIYGATDVLAVARSDSATLVVLMCCNRHIRCCFVSGEEWMATAKWTHSPETCFHTFTAVG